MEVAKVLHMNGGIGDSSYANNSLLQNMVILMTKSVIDEAISALYHDLLPETICIADLGCSSGPNNFLAIYGLIETIHKECKKKIDQKPLEFHVFLNDLPGNDFNTIFQSLLPEFQEKLRKQIGDGFSPNCFVTGVPGSFFGRLFPSKSLHFVHSSYSLHWLSQGSIEEEKADSFNMPIYTPSTTEVMHVVEKEGSFTIDCLETSEIHWEAFDENNGGYNVAKRMRAVIEPLLVSHFGYEVMDQVFHKFGEIVADCMLKEKPKFINVIVSVTKRN